MKLRINKMRTTFENENCFSRNDTYVVKGIAIVAMVLHHVYPNSTGTPIYMLDNKDAIGLVASCGKSLPNTQAFSLPRRCRASRGG